MTEGTKEAGQRTVFHEDHLYERHQEVTTRERVRFQVDEQLMRE